MRSVTQFVRRHNAGPRRWVRRGSVIVLMAACMVLIMAFAAFSVDVGYITLMKARCQKTADAAAHVAALELRINHADLAAARNAAVSCANVNMPNSGTVLKGEDVVFGRWNFDSRTFTPTNAYPNAVQVTVRRAAQNSNPLNLFFSPVIGHSQADVTATATATGMGPQFRFLLDEEILDTDVPEIEDLAASLGTSGDSLLTDGNGDGFIDMPPGTKVWVPTGQVGDEGLFDRTTYDSAFPFGYNSDYTMLDFLAEGTALESSLGTQNLMDETWTGSNAPHPDLIGNKVLDPVLGCDPQQSHAAIMDLPDPDQILVSPLFKSDVAMAQRNDDKYGAPAANLQGQRRGLLAFKILDAKPHPVGGSYLPMIQIEIIDPDEIDMFGLSYSVPSWGGAIHLVE